MKLQTINEYATAINEAFKSTKLNKLNKALNNTDKKYGLETSKLWNALAIRLNQRASEIEDKDVYFTTGKYAKKYFKDRTKDLMFHIEDNILIGITQGGKNVRLTANVFKSNSANYNWKNEDPKGMQQIKGKHTTFNTGGTSLYDKSGKGGLGSKELGRYDDKVKSKDLWSPNTNVYVIVEPTKEEQKFTSDLMSGRISLWGNNLTTASQFRQDNINRYKELSRLKKVKDREGKQFDVKLSDMLINIKPRIEKFVASVLEKPEDYLYKSFDHNVTYGERRDRRTYTTSILQLYTDMHKDYDSMITNFKEGKSFSTSSFTGNHSKIDTILKKLKF